MLAGQAVRYKDTGCEYSPQCLECPLLECKYDAEQTIHQVKPLRRNKGYQICQDFNQGMSGKELAVKYVIALSTVYSHTKEGHRRGWTTRDGRGRHCGS